MESVIVLIYGEGRHLVPKPADYETLLDVARVKFPELYDFDHDTIAFHFTPEWFGDEVVLDRNAFAQVQDRDILRITATASAAAQQPWNKFKVQNDAVSATVSSDAPTGWMKLWFIHVPTDRKVGYIIKPRQKFRRIMVHMATLLEFDLDYAGFYFDDDMLEAHETPQDVGMAFGDLIEVHNLT